eukprot:136089-Pyramimonas_sp.AAC.1
MLRLMITVVTVVVMMMTLRVIMILRMRSRKRMMTRINLFTCCESPPEALVANVATLLLKTR